jgi:hypothetical protein
MARSSPVDALKTNTRLTYFPPIAKGTFTRRRRPVNIGYVTISEVSHTVVTPDRGSEAQDVFSPW